MKTTTKNNMIPYLSLIFLFLSPIILSIPVGAQTGWGPPRSTNLYPSRVTSILPIILSIFITGLFFMIFFFIYIRVCSGGGDARIPLGGNRRAMETVVVSGLDSSVIETFPTFSYSEVKDHKIGKGALECAVCLNEFEDDQTLRLIPKCDHVFHPECIDAWLMSHVTCPVCRADLVPKPGDEPVQVPGLTIHNEEIHDDSNGERSILRNDEIVIDIGDIENEHQEEKGEMNLSFQYPNRPPKGQVNRNLSFQYPNRSPVNQNLSFGNLNGTITGRVNRNLSLKRPSPLMRPRMFGRSHTMGNILVQPGGDTERFTLRLPRNVRKEVMNRALLNRTRSFATTSTTQGRSSKGHETDRIQRSNREVKSDRWDFFTRTFSMTMRSPRTPKVVTETGESSGSTSKGAGSRTLDGAHGCT